MVEPLLGQITGIHIAPVWKEICAEGEEHRGCNFPRLVWVRSLSEDTYPIHKYASPVRSQIGISLVL